jgi:hypothetical protein
MVNGFQSARNFLKLSQLLTKNFYQCSTYTSCFAASNCGGITTAHADISNNPIITGTMFPHSWTTPSGKTHKLI